ncbi:hypothetical protein D9M72_481140 [compost metagenome]
MLRVSSMVRNVKTPGLIEPLGVYRPSIGGMNDWLPVAMISTSYGTTWPLLAKTYLVKRSIRSTRTPACSVMLLSWYQCREFRKMSASLSSPERTWLSMILL